MAKESSDDSYLMDKIMNRIKGPGESGPSRTDSSQRKVLFSLWYFIAAMRFFSWFQGYMGGQQTQKVTSSIELYFILHLFCPS
jgi:hypothetical protein